MARKRYNLNLDPELVARVDVAAGDVSRSRWVERALEAALDDPWPGTEFTDERGLRHLSPERAKAMEEAGKRFLDETPDDDLGASRGTPAPNPEPVPASPRASQGLGKGYMPPRPKSGR